MQFARKALGVALAAAGATASASGSHSAFDWSDAERYEWGKRVFTTRVSCASCPYPGLEPTPGDAAEIISELRFDARLGKSMSVFERRALRHFLERRFALPD